MTNNIQLDLQRRRAFAEGETFGDVGAYERLDGQAHFTVDPMASGQLDVVDLDKAALNGDGLVTFSADISIIKPVEMANANGRLFFDYGNRGNMRAIQFFNDAPASNDPISTVHAGNGYLMRRGYVVANCAWQGDLWPGDGRMTMDLPVATENGASITGLVRSEFIVTAPGQACMPLSGRASTRSHPAVSLDTSTARLTRRRYPEDEREGISGDRWAFARIEGGVGLDNQGAETAIVPSDVHVLLPEGFETGWIYEIVYTGKDPLVMGLGHVAVRDFVSFLKNDSADSTGQVNPLGDTIEKAYAWGRSQTGRCIRDMIHQGFNADVEGRRVFDGVLPHVSGGGLMWLNHRFACGVSAAGQQYEDHENMADRFPFSYAETTDHITGTTDAILKRPETDPLVLHTQTGTEYWQRHGSLVHTDTEGNDLEQPDTVRVFLWSSSQHFADPNQKQPSRGICQNNNNIVKTSMFFRGMLNAMDAWATDGTLPPESRIPRRADGTLVTAEEWHKQFPNVPGLSKPSGPNGLPAYDFGPDAAKGFLTKQPPDIGDGAYTVLIPAVDTDGNDISGVRAPMVEAPLGTYTGWNLRARGQGEGYMHEFTGSYLPLPETESVRRSTGDSRRSIVDRYGDTEGYVRAVVSAAKRLVEDGLMLEEDVDRIAAAAADWGRPLHDVRL